MYKNKRIAIVFFARSQSTRLKNKLFKKIFNTNILTINFKIMKKIKFVDEKILATTTKNNDNKIIEIANNNNLKFYRGSEKNVLKRFVEACNHLEKKPDIIIRYCCENPLTSSRLIEENIKRIIDQKADLISILPPSNAIFGISSVIMKYSTLNKVYKKANHQLYKEHVENYCYDYPENFKIIYPVHEKKYFFPDTNFSIDTLNDFKRVNNIFEKLKLKFGKYKYQDIKNHFFKKKIYIEDIRLFDYCYNNFHKIFSFTKKLNEASFIFCDYKKKLKLHKNKVYFKLRNDKNNLILFCEKNYQKYDLFTLKVYKNFKKNDYFKLFFEILINKTIFWPPMEPENLISKTKNFKILKNNLIYKYNEYFPSNIISNAPLDIKYGKFKVLILDDINFLKKIKIKKYYDDKIFVYNNYFVYYKNNRIIKIKKFDFFQITSIWRSYEYRKFNL